MNCARNASSAAPFLVGEPAGDRRAAEDCRLHVGRGPPEEVEVNARQPRGSRPAVPRSGAAFDVPARLASSNAGWLMVSNDRAQYRTSSSSVVTCVM